MPQALIVCDFPILAWTAERLLGDRYQVYRRTWSDQLDDMFQGAELVIADITNLASRDALRSLVAASGNARVVVCSLDQNEVEVYRSTPNGLEIESELSSLLSLSA